jgi:hypothetical protein
MGLFEITNGDERLWTDEVCGELIINTHDGEACRSSGIHLSDSKVVRLRDYLTAWLDDAGVCGHGLADGEWCPECNLEHKEARANPENGNGD